MEVTIWLRNQSREDGRDDFSFVVEVIEEQAFVRCQLPFRGDSGRFY
jgi:hypothetical protein